MKQVLCWIAMLLLPGTVAAVQAPSPQYRLEDLNLRTGLELYSVGDLNDRGDFTFQDPSGMAYLYRDGQAQQLVNAYSFRLELNDRGDVAGTYLNAEFKSRPFLYRNGRVIDLAASLGAREGSAASVNRSGQVVGTADGKAFLYDGVHSRYLNLATDSPSSAFDISDHGVIVGAIRNDFWADAFVYREGKTELLPRVGDTPDYPVINSATRINNAGSIVVQVEDPNTYLSYSLIYENGAYLPGRPPHTFDLNDRGWAVGSREVFDDVAGDWGSLAVVYRDGERHDLQDLVTGNGPHWQMLFSGNAINEKGQIVGMGRLMDGSVHAFLATPVPEPSIQALLLCGTGFMGWVLYRRRSRPA